VGGKRHTTESFIQAARQIHGDKYDYSKVRYSGSRKITIVCRKHGSFSQTPDNHLSGRNCRKCGYEQRSIPHKLTQADFLRRSSQIHQNKYDYSRVRYLNSSTKIEIGCPLHGYFLQTPAMHIYHENGCQDCWYDRVGNRWRMTFDQFIRKSKKIHGTKFRYVSYSNGNRAKNIRKKATLICPYHGQFIQDVESHLNGKGCAACRESKGERAVRYFLEKNNIPFRAQARLIISAIKYSFDFQLLDRPTLVEFHGEQHYKPVDFSSRNQRRANKQFKVRRRRDRFKAAWAKSNGYELITIKYTENVEEVLSRHLPTTEKLAA
jgi:Zn ribbon nucleic-acid-binding protein